jgi:hypothetical protein
MKRRSYQAYLRKQDAAKSGISDTRIPSVIDGDSGITSSTSQNPQNSSPSNQHAKSKNKFDIDYIWQVFNWCIGFSALASLEILASKYMQDDSWLLFVVIVIAFMMFISGTILMYSIVFPRIRSAWAFSIITAFLFLGYISMVFLLGWPLVILLIGHRLP